MASNQWHHRINTRGRWTALAASAGLSLLATSALGCATNDVRPVIENASGSALEIESLHFDGRTLTAILQPGAKLPLGTTRVGIMQVQAHRSGRMVLSLSEADVDACIEQPARSCMGWRLDDRGATRFGEGSELGEAPKEARTRTPQRQSARP